jgi:hypothetical protein
MTSTHVRNARKAATDFVKQARERITNAGEKAEEIRGSSVYTPEGKEELAGGWASEARKAAASAGEKARARAAGAREKAEEKLKASRAVSESERATAAAILSPVIAAAATDPTVLVRAYERRAADSLPDRIILEESIQACIDAGLGGATFVEDWQRTRNALAGAVQSEEEREAIADLVAVDALETYIGAAETELEAAAEGVEGGSSGFTIRGETARHTVATYERALEDGTLDAGAPTVRRAEDVLRSTEDRTPAEEIVPQEIPEAVRRDTEARRAALAGL